ncbi:LacI family DNA-binding transcriptional regulator [Ideonella sp. BN130291]|uniref:LacI family DNA-binding transcriptional regulator n=1 Tax=Ideonella sp. BN130291 TaxID=3112940 RepID=UPI002E2656BF|nr:LacI family DNA-binding transcriptional regulator [Ideonella sp. BN130291]
MLYAPPVPSRAFAWPRRSLHPSQAAPVQRPELRAVITFIALEAGATVRRCAPRHPATLCLRRTSVPTSKPTLPRATPPRTRRRSDAPTLLDVARAAGVSEMAASSALNGGRRGSARVSTETRERVLAAAEQLGFRPNATARALANRRTNAIGFVANFLGEEPNLYFLEVFSGVIQGATAAGQTTAVFTLNDWAEAPARLPALCDGRVDGLILLGPRLQDDGSAWLPRHTPMVSVQADRSVNGAVNVESDDESGAHGMVQRLLSMGHRRILYVAGPSDLSGPNLRVHGYMRAHAEAGVKPAAGHVVRAPLSIEGGREAMQDWLRRHRGRQLPQAVFGGNDAIAFGCAEVLRARGLRVPDDVSVVGYDHTLMARWVQMATVRQPLHELGRRAVEELVRRIDTSHQGEPHAGPSSIVLPTEIVPGATLAPPRRSSLTIT